MLAPIHDTSARVGQQNVGNILEVNLGTERVGGKEPVVSRLQVGARICTYSRNFRVPLEVFFTMTCRERIQFKTE